MLSKILNRIHHYQSINLVILIIRFWLGTAMIWGSTHYLFRGHMVELTESMDGWGFPFPGFMAILSQSVELITAIMIIVGLRIGAIILAINMAIAVIFAHQLLIYTEGQLAFCYFVFALILSLVGCGKPALDNKFFKGD